MNTFHNWGSSSIEYLRMNLPTGVMRGSSFILKSTPLPSFCSMRRFLTSSASVRMERNFTILKSSPFRPTRLCKKNTGPPSRLTMSATTTNNGDNRIRPRPEATTSTTRLKNADRPVIRGVDTCTSGRPFNGCICIRGPAMSVVAGAIISEIWASASFQPSRRT